MDPDQPPAAASEVAADVKGEGFVRKRAVLRMSGMPWDRGELVCTHLYTPDFVVNQPWPASERGAAFLRPPLPAFKPPDGFGAHGVVPAGPLEGHRLAGGVADDVNRFAEHAHGRLPELTGTVARNAPIPGFSNAVIRIHIRMTPVYAGALTKPRQGWTGRDGRGRMVA
jgi:hypothetical protein